MVHSNIRVAILDRWCIGEWGSDMLSHVAMEINNV